MTHTYHPHPPIRTHTYRRKQGERRKENEHTPTNKHATTLTEGNGREKLRGEKNFKERKKKQRDQGIEQERG